MRYYTDKYDGFGNDLETMIYDNPINKIIKYWRYQSEQQFG